MYIRCNLLYTHNVFQIKLKWYFKCKKNSTKIKQQKYWVEKMGLLFGHTFFCSFHKSLIDLLEDVLHGSIKTGHNNVLEGFPIGQLYWGL